LLVDSDAAAGEMEWRGVAMSMVSRILPDRAFSCSSSFVVGDVGVVESSNAAGSDKDSEQLVRSNGDSRAPGISVVIRELFSVTVSG
jgi:hypothetical protein